MNNKEDLPRYRCYWCDNVMNENRILIKDKEERNKYKNVVLPYRYCKECYDYIQWENKTYGFD